MSYGLDYDARRNLIKYRVGGFMGDEEGAAFARDLRKMVDDVRCRGRAVRALFDNSEGVVYAPSTLETMTAALTGLFRADDRTALVTGSTLAKIQSRRTRREETPVFTTEEEAIAWLTRQ